MRFEKVSENQIRCTLDQHDFESRHMQMKELSYGTDKAKELFQEMLQTAASEYGFDTEDFPIMIEAVPLSMDSLMLVITKVEDPDELDTRFSRFAEEEEDPEEDPAAYEEEEAVPERADDIINLFEQLQEGAITPKDGMMPFADSQTVTDGRQDTAISREDAAAVNLIQVYRFDCLDTVCDAASTLSPFYEGENSLYKEPKSGDYFLSINKSGNTPDEFNRVCNQLSEYGSRIQNLYATEAFFEEHCKCVIKDKAIQVLASL